MGNKLFASVFACSSWFLIIPSVSILMMRLFGKTEQSEKIGLTQQHVSISQDALIPISSVIYHRKQNKFRDNFTEFELGNIIKNTKSYSHQIERANYNPADDLIIDAHIGHCRYCKLRRIFIDSEDQIDKKILNYCNIGDKFDESLIIQSVGSQIQYRISPTVNDFFNILRNRKKFTLIMCPCGETIKW